MSPRRRLSEGLWDEMAKTEGISCIAEASAQCGQRASKEKGLNGEHSKQAGEISFGLEFVSSEKCFPKGCGFSLQTIVHHTGLVRGKHREPNT